MHRKIESYYNIIIYYIIYISKLKIRDTKMMVFLYKLSFYTMNSIHFINYLSILLFT